VESAASVEVSTVLDAETASRLAALGYIGAGRDQGEVPVAGLADPKDRIELWNLLGEAEAARQSHREARALHLFDQVLAVEPTNPFALSRSGALLVENEGEKQIEEGVRRLEAGVAASASDVEAWVTLAAARGRLHRWPQSAEAWQQVIRLQPRRREAWIGLANALGMAQQPKEAVLALEGWLAVSPDDLDALLRLAFARVGAGETEGAARDLEVVERRQGGAFQHSGALGILLVRLGQEQTALSWLRRSRPGEGDFVAARVALARIEVDRGDEAAARKALGEAVAKDPSVSGRLAADVTLRDFLP
jgi:predicted Zn-dependent protease